MIISNIYIYVYQYGMEKRNEDKKHGHKNSFGKRNKVDQDRRES